MELLAALAAGGAVLLLTLAIMRSRQATPADRRIRRLLAPETAPAPRGIAWDDVARGRGSRLPVFRDWLSNSEWAERTQTEIDQSGIRLRVGEYAIIRAVLAAVFFIVPAVLISAPAGIVMGLAGAAIGFYAPKIWLSTIRKRRIAAVAKQLPEAITMIANALRAGFAFQHGLDMVSKQMEPPISEEFTRVTVDLNVGSTVEEAMNALLVRSNSEDMNMMVTAILVQRTSGGNLAEILETVAETMRERERLVGEVRTLTSQQRFSGMVLSLWPLLLLGFFSLINWDQTSLLFTTGMGQILLMIMLLGNLLGYYTIKRILDVDI
jgi:tight adherence protein B